MRRPRQSLVGSLEGCREIPKLCAVVESHPNVEKRDVRMGYPATVIGHWLSQQNKSLSRVVLVIDKDPNSSELTISRLGFNDLSPIQSVRLT